MPRPSLAWRAAPTSLPSALPVLATPLLTLPDTPAGALSIRAKALLFHDPGSLALLAHIERLAASEATALVFDETGTGKELVARHIHHVSGRRGPFVAVNCGAFSESLIDAELFGHEAGAFTGATSARSGWFEAANGGTLFLDEIGDLSLPLQVKLLRVLQERQVVRLGSRKPVPLDVRLVAATNIDLQQAVAAQRFRADLYYRLSVAPVALPPLRERRGDILPLARHFMGVYGQRLHLSQPAQLTPAAEQALLAYPWPGNIRELENVIHFALIVSRDGLIDPADLKLVSPLPQSLEAVAAHQAGAAAPRQVAAAAAAALPEEGTRPLLSLFQALLDQGTLQLAHTVESTLVHVAFAHCRANQVQTARALGITRNSLRTLLKRHGLLGEAEATSDALDTEATHKPPAARLAPLAAPAATPRPESHVAARPALHD